MELWVLFFDNVEGDNSVELYANYKDARDAFEDYAKKYANMNEFQRTKDAIYWFDPDINSYSSCISLFSQEVF